MLNNEESPPNYAENGTNKVKVKWVDNFGHQLIKSSTFENNGVLQKTLKCERCCKHFEIDPYINRRNRKYCNLCRWITQP